VLLTGKLPFKGANEKEVLKKVRSGVYDINIPELTNVSNEAKNMIMQMLTKNP
jgi:hypothetical protein